MQLPPKLQPFWYTPEFQSGPPPHVEFKLRPLTQAEMIEVEELYTPPKIGEPPRSTRAAQFRAGMLAIVACKHITDEHGEPIRWPIGIDTAGPAAEELRRLIVMAGLRIIVEMNGQDWEAIVGTAEKVAGGEQPAESDPTKT